MPYFHGIFDFFKLLLPNLKIMGQEIRFKGTTLNFVEIILLRMNSTKKLSAVFYNIFKKFIYIRIDKAYYFFFIEPF